MVYSLLFFITEICAIVSVLFYTLKVRLRISTMLVSVGMIGLPAVLLYVYVFNWVGLIYFVLSAIGVFYMCSKNMRVCLDVFMLLTASIVSESIVQLIRIRLFSELHESYVFLAEKTVSVNVISILVFMLPFLVFAYLYCVFIKKTWNVIAISVVSQVLFIAIAFITVTVLSLNLFVSLSDNLYYPALFNLLMQTLYFVIMFVLLALLFRNSRKQNKINQKETEQEQLLQYMQALERVNRDMQGFRHDYKNILLTR